ncbi:MAG: hypothetical protein QM734_11175 [Cyclobacteriaceae bacterium]
MSTKGFKQKIQDKFDEIVEKPLLTSTIVLICVAVLVISLSMSYYIKDFHGFWGQILAEAHGNDL